MSQDAVNQNINLNVSGAEKVAEATALLQDFQGMIQQVLTNPAYSAYAWHKIGNSLERAFVDPLKKSVQLTQAQGMEFDRLVSKSRALVTVTGFISGMAAALAKTTLEIQKASAELGKFTSFNNMPGGASNLFQAQTSIMKMTADNTIEFNEQFAQQTEQVYLELRRKLVGGGMDEKGVRELTKRLALLQAGLGVNAPAFVSGLANQYRLRGLDEKAASQIFGLIMGEVQKGKTLPFFSPQEAAGVFTQGVQQVGGNPITGTRQVLDVMQTYGNVAGPNEMQQLFQILPQFLNELNKNITLKGLYSDKYGLKQSDLTGDKALVNLANLFAKEVQSVTGGKPIENTMDYINKGGLVSKTILERLGISNDMLQLFNSLPKNQKAITELSDAFEKMRLGKDALASTKDLAGTLDQIEESLRNSSSLLEWFGAYWTKISTSMAGGAKDLGIDPKLLQAAALGLGIGGVVGFGPKMLRGFLKSVGIPLTSLTKEVSAGAKMFDASTGMFVRGAETVAGATAEVSAGLNIAKTGMRLASRIFWGLLAAEVIAGAYDEITGTKGGLWGFEPSDATQKRMKEVQMFGARYDYPISKSAAMQDATYIPVVPKDMTAADLQSSEYFYSGHTVADRKKEQQRLSNTHFRQMMLGLPAPTTVSEGNLPFKFGKDALQDSVKTFDDMQRVLNESKVLKKEEGTIEEEGAAGDIGNLRIIVSNDAGNELANTTLNEARNQGGIRLIMSAISEA